MEENHRGESLPLYSPELNPIEQVFAKRKHVAAQAAKQNIGDIRRRVESTLRWLQNDERG